MAKINVEFDTKDKSLSVSMDGKAMANVAGISLYQSYDDEDEFRCNVVMATKDDTNDIRTVTSIYASEQPKADEQEKAFAEAGFKVSKASPQRANPIHRDIAEFLKKV
ncbi:MAG: hypothetical protein K2R98_19460 [Gemmataceae bacterium]|nr:hypothetical protein [Gemmataceae bacterium]